MKDAEAVTFGGGTLDRGSALRGRPDVVAALLADPRSRCLPIWRGRPLIEETEGGLRLAWSRHDAPVLASAEAPLVFLGLNDAIPEFAREIPDWDGSAADLPRPFYDDERDRHPALPPTQSFRDLRMAMAALPAGEASDAAAAKGILAWHASHRFCAMCGSRSEVSEAGWRRTCPACGTQHFPRTDPVVIMLVTHGNAVLLGRSPAWPAGMYSLLAGFMEPGESIEGAVRRETFEETGVKVGRVDYLSSQPWPFPSSLMIGCRGEALSREITRDPAELDDARWVERERVVDALTGRDLELKPARRGSIARFLLERWLADRLG